ncbi:MULTISPECIES: alpha/beta hydrolase fold domain-containing protein [unclassified Microbacterium]|uniref:alpha/beta hydrolase fold domain-containing protein n=1 Tax=Microbacterium TaxID=33882 RepID=UPI003B9EA925
MSSSTERTLRDVVYATRPGFRPLSLDLHRPEADGAPLIVFVHGGGWRVGSRRVMCPTLAPEHGFPRLVAEGFAVASVDYRLSGEAVFPAPLDDVAAALAWLREHQGALAVDATRIVLWGESAGAHLAALAGLSDGAVRGVVDWYGPSDLFSFPAPAASDERPTREEALLGGAVADLPERARAASPARQVAAGAPPFHIAHGLADTAVPAAQSEALHAALVAAGADATLQLVPGAGHLWQGLDDPDLVLSPALAFARRVTG